MSLVVDASVVIKWFVNEPLHENARQILTSREELHAPDLLISEIGNIAWKKMMRGEIEETHAQSIALSLRGLPITLRPSVELIDRALQIATAIKHPVYDCLYLACAETLGSRLVTADEKLKRVLAESTLSTICRSLGDRYDIALSAETIKRLIALLKHAKSTWQTIEGNDVALHLDTPAFVRIKNAIQELSDSERTDLVALGSLRSGSVGRDWLLAQRNAKGGLLPENLNDLIDLIRQSEQIEVGWQKLQELAKVDAAEKK
jgi:predicted nucleic acid-binding protein